MSQADISRIISAEYDDVQPRRKRFEIFIYYNILLLRYRRVQKNTGKRPSKSTRWLVAGAEKFPGEKRSRVYEQRTPSGVARVDILYCRFCFLLKNIIGEPLCRSIVRRAYNPRGSTLIIEPKKKRTSRRTKDLIRVSHRILLYRGIKRTLAGCRCTARSRV